METEYRERLTEVCFQRMACGEDENMLRSQLSSKLSSADADDVIAQVTMRFQDGRGRPDFERSINKIRRRRLVGQRYLLLKVTAGVFIFFGIVSLLQVLSSGGQTSGSFGGVLIGGIIFAVVEWRERIRMDSGVLPAGEPLEMADR